MPHASSVGGTRIFFEVHEPDAPSELMPVVLLQGLGLSSRFWFDIPRDLAQDHGRPRRVVTLDNRGVGRSDRPRGPYRMRDMADDVAAVLDAAGVSRAIVAGISLGGMIAMNFAIRHSSRISGLVLLATTPGLPHGRLPGPGALARLFAMPLLRGRRSRWADRALLPEGDLDRAAQLFARWPAALRQDPVRLGAFVSQVAAAAGHSVGFRLAKIAVPTVVLAGADDILIPPVNARRIARRIPRSYVQVLPGVAHAMPSSNPRIIQDALEILERMDR